MKEKKTNKMESEWNLKKKHRVATSQPASTTYISPKKSKNLTKKNVFVGNVGSEGREKNTKAAREQRQ